MELDDCRFPLLKCVKFGSNAKELLKGVDYVIMLASLPMLQGEERRDLIKKNTALVRGFGEDLNLCIKPTSKLFHQLIT